MAQEPYAQNFIGSANVSSIKVDGEVVAGAQSLSIRWERERKNVYEVGSDVRRGIDFGQLFITGALQVRSTFQKLDQLMLLEPGQIKSFQMLIEIKKGALPVKTMALDQCYVERKEFGIDANGQGLSTYVFTATRMREDG